MTETDSSTIAPTPQSTEELVALLRGRTPEELAAIRDAVGAMLLTAPLPAGAPIAPEFVEMLAENAQKVVMEWLDANAPEDVRELSSAADSMRFYVEGVRAGSISALVASDIPQTVVEAINRMSALGHSFVDDYGAGHGRK